MRCQNLFLLSLIPVEFILIIGTSAIVLLDVGALSLLNMYVLIFMAEIFAVMLS